MHGIGTVIGKGVKTEGPVKIYQGVTLGGNSNKRRIVQNKEFSQPWLKDGVIVYANATVIGPVIIECGSVVGTNAVITKDIPEGCVVYTKVEMVIK
ncbi:hypothetical protein PCCS19_11900 [Paenibacillus sp. CCS19]|nr:hypothetical protein PCCS19_11900 [Paenibacillus cellulosilyticus]